MSLFSADTSLAAQKLDNLGQRLWVDALLTECLDECDLFSVKTLYVSEVHNLYQDEVSINLQTRGHRSGPQVE